jgi:hypothetical protein
VIESRECQHARDVLLVAMALFGGARLLAQVLIPVPEREAALHEKRGVARFTVNAVLHGESEHR